jgi:hypothetical protein
MVKTESSIGVDTRLLSRILTEGYGPGAWHGADIKAAIADVSPEAAQRRPVGLRPSASSGLRHNIAEIVLHHAYYVHSVRGRLTTVKPEPFPLSGDDWFLVDAGAGPAWDEAQRILEQQYARLASLVQDIGSGAATVVVDGDAALEMILGLSCHSAYHAGQIQLIKILAAEPATV